MKSYTRRTRGFTLVELMVAMVILGIGIMATMAMQFSSLAGAMISRDNSNAADIGQRVIEVMQAESQQWRGVNTVSGVSRAYTATSQPNSAASTSYLELAVGTTPKETGWGDWKLLFDKAVNTRLTPTDDARYCVFVRGGSVDADGELLIVHVAVVFPSANQIIPASGCAAAVEKPETQLDPTLKNSDTGSLQMAGYRVQFFGTQIARKDYLDIPLVSTRP